MRAFALLLVLLLPPCAFARSAQDVAAAPAAGRAEGGAPGGSSFAPADEARIRQEVLAHDAEIRRCYTEAMPRRHSLAGKVTVRFLFDEAGVVRTAEVAESTAADALLEGCIVQAVKGWSFAPLRARRMVRVSYPFVFRVAGAPDTGARSSGDVEQLVVTAAGPEDKEVIRAVVRRNVEQIRGCYESQLAAHPQLEGRVPVAFVISASGSVSHAEVVRGTTGVPDLERCVAQAVRGWQFPRPRGNGEVRVTYPFIFKKSEDTGASDG